VSRWHRSHATWLWFRCVYRSGVICAAWRSDAKEQAWVQRDGLTEVGWDTQVGVSSREVAGGVMSVGI
jgi:hypothetical protein